MANERNLRQNSHIVSNHSYHDGTELLLDNNASIGVMVTERFHDIENCIKNTE